MNQLLSAGNISYKYDEDGNMIEKNEGDTTWLYEYNSENRLVKVNNGNKVWEYEYDALGNRSAVIVDGNRTEYLIDPTRPFGNIVAEYDSNGQVIANYSYGLGLESRHHLSDSASFYDFDGLGSTIGISNMSGKYVNTYHYLPFGGEQLHKETIEQPFQFVGEFGVTNEKNGLHYMQLRFYTASCARFTSPDPININGGFNLYNYCGNSPLVYIDPIGCNPRGAEAERIRKGMQSGFKGAKLGTTIVSILGYVALTSNPVTLTRLAIAGIVGFFVP